MCGHIGLLVNLVFSLTRIFHGSAGGMSSGHTWHWGTPERSHQIPLGKPGLVIPRCETLASRSVTFPLHQSRVQRCTPSPFLAMRICNWGSRGGREKKGSAKQRRRRTLAPLAQQQHSSKKKKRSAIIHPTPRGAHETVLTQLELTSTSLQSGEEPCAVCYVPHEAVSGECKRLGFKEHRRSLPSSSI